MIRLAGLLAHGHFTVRSVSGHAASSAQQIAARAAFFLSVQYWRTGACSACALHAPARRA